VDDLGTILLVFFLGDPLGLESSKGTESGSTSPDGVVSVSWGNDLDHVGLWCHGVELFLESIRKSFIKGGSTGEDDVLVKVSSDVHITVVDGGLAHLVYTEGLVSFLDEVWVEEGFWSEESWLVDGNSGTIGELVVLGEFGGGRGLLLIGGWVNGDEANLLLHGVNNLLPSGFSSDFLNSVKGEEFEKMGGNGSTGDEVLSDGVRNGETFEDWDGVSNTISLIGDKTGGSTVGVEGHDGLDGNVHTLDLMGLEHDGGHLLSVGLWV